MTPRPRPQAAACFVSSDCLHPPITALTSRIVKGETGIRKNHPTKLHEICHDQLFSWAVIVGSSIHFFCNEAAQEK